MIHLRRYPHILFRSVVLLACAAWFTTAPAQSIQQPHTKSDLTDRSPFRIDPSTLGLNIEIPLGSYPLRGGGSLPITLFYSSKIHQIQFLEVGNPEYQYFNTWSTPAASEVGGWKHTLEVPYVAAENVFWYDHNGNATTNCGWSCKVVRRVRINMPGGSSVEFRHTSPVATWVAGQPAPSFSGTYYAVDGSQMRYEYDSQVLYLGDGSRYVLGNYATPTIFYDRNGNTRSYDPQTSSWSDGLRTIADPFRTMQVGNNYYTIPGVGSSLTYNFRWVALEDALTDPTQELLYPADCTDPNQLTSDFCCGYRGSLFQSSFPNSVCSNGNLYNPLVLAEIVLPTGQSYKFSYNLFGEIDKVIYPWGGYEKYRYDQLPASDWIRTFYEQANRGVVERWISPKGDGSDEQHWQYEAKYADPNNYTPPYTVTITAPDESRTVRYLYTAAQDYAWGFRDVRAGRAYEERTYSASNELLRRTLTEWTGSVQSSSAGNYANARNGRVTKEIEILLDTGGAYALSRATVFDYDADNNLTSTSKYDFVDVDQGTAQTASIASFYLADYPLRTEETTYLVNDPFIDAGIRSAYRTRNLLSLPSSSRVRDGGGNIVAQSSIAYDESSLLVVGNPSGWTDPQTIYRGNPTSIASWLNTTNTYLTTQRTYDQFGSVRTITDAKGNQSQIDYSATYSFAYPTLTTSADPDGAGPLTALTTATEYHVETGLPTARIDSNGERTTFAYADPLNRLTQTIRAANGGVNEKNQTTINYDDVNRTVTTTSDQNTYNDNTLKTQTVSDGLGRPRESRQYEGGSNYIAVQTEYDLMGRPFKTSNPFRPWLGETAIWTTSAFDALSRVTSATTPDGAVVTTAYSGNQLLIADQAGKKRISRTDALGRLKDVWEVTGADQWTVAISFQNYSNLYAYHTSYNYDALDNLTSVNQGTQVRTFAYDSLKRLISAANPESGTINYQYDGNGNLTSKTDARSITATYTYDALNRALTRSYSDGTPTVTYVYDTLSQYGKGRLTSISSSVSSYSYSGYDAMGRVTGASQTIGAQSYLITDIGYDLAGHLKTMKYPSGRTIANTFDDAGRLSSFAGDLGDDTQRTYSTGIIYSAFGRRAKEQFGTDTPLFNKSFFNSRGQLAEMRVSTSYTGPTDTTWNRGAIINHYSYQCWGMCWGPNSTTPMTDNNGNLRKQDVYIPADNQISSYTMRWQEYDYDSLNRLQWVREISGETEIWRQSYVYDRYSNRTINYNGTTAGIPRPQFDANDFQFNNRLYAPGDTAVPMNQRQMQYDAAGNLTKDTHSGAAVNRLYDAENRMTKETQAGGVDAGVYSYDGEGRRVKRKVNGVETWQIYGLLGEVIAEYAENAPYSSPHKEYGYRNGELLVSTETGTTSAAQPSGLAATPPVSGASVTLNWTAASGATNYRVERQGPGGSYSLVGTTANTALTDNTTTSGSAYLYKVCAANGSGNCTSGYSNIALGAAVTFLTDPTIKSYSEDPANATSPKAAHIIELRAAINAVRTLAGLSVITTPNPAVGDLISVNNVRDLRTKLAEALTPLGIQLPTYTDATLKGFVEDPLNATTIKAVHIRELRQAATYGVGGSAGGGSSFQIHWLVTDQLGTARMIFDSTGSLTITDQNGNYVSGVTRHDYLPFGEELFASTGGRTTAQGYTQSDNVRQKFTSKERDNETGLDYFLARYYSSTQGRFTSADPLYLEFRRLSDPQQLNLYGYCRNNPLRYSDPTGLDIVITGVDAEKLKDDFNNRKNAQFKIKLDSNGMAQIVDKDKIKVGKLSKSERALFDAITDPDHHATIEGTGADDRIEMGAFGPELGKKAGTNVIDTADMALLRGADKKLAGESVSHEMLEAYESAKTGSTTWKPNHDAASKFFPEPTFTEFSSLPGEKGLAVRTGYTGVWTWQGFDPVKVTYKFRTPQPIPSVSTTQPAADMVKIEKKK